VLQCVAVCCSVLQCVAVCCSVLQRVAVCCSVLQCLALLAAMMPHAKFQKSALHVFYKVIFRKRATNCRALLHEWLFCQLYMYFTII